MPLVCSRWRDLMDHPMMWPVLDVTLAPASRWRQCVKYHSEFSRPDVGNSMEVWVQSRGYGIRKLTMRASTQHCSCP